MKNVKAFTLTKHWRLTAMILILYKILLSILPKGLTKPTIGDKDFYTIEQTPLVPQEASTYRTK